MSRVIIIREELMELAGGDMESAALLQQFCFWTTRCADEQGWIARSADELVVELFACASRWTVARKVNALVDRRLLEKQPGASVYRVNRNVPVLENAVVASAPQGQTVPPFAARLVQNAPTHEQIAHPEREQIAPVLVQNAPDGEQNAPTHEQIAPVLVQNAPTHEQIAPAPYKVARAESPLEGEPLETLEREREPPPPPLHIGALCDLFERVRRPVGVDQAVQLWAECEPQAWPSEQALIDYVHRRVPDMASRGLEAAKICELLPKDARRDRPKGARARRPVSATAPQREARAVQSSRPISEAAKAVWDEALKRLKHQVSSSTYESWLVPLRPLEVSHDVFVLEAVDEFTRDWIAERWLDLIEGALRSVGVEVPVVVRFAGCRSIAATNRPDHVRA